jgi:SDR family mycofactocin-dependent oxidoreductase
MSGRLNGKVVFITGVARGQGRSHAVRFAEEGADIIGIDICETLDGVDYAMSNQADLDETIAMVEKLDRRIIAGVADVRDRESMRVVLDRGLAELGRLDCVIANAGVMPVYGKHANELRSWDLCLDILLTGVMHTVELTYPHLIEQGAGGSIAITSSVAALHPAMRTENGKTLGVLGYAAAKAALMNLARNYASVLAEHSIRVNTVHPTGVRTPMAVNDMMAEYWPTMDPRDLAGTLRALPIDMVEPSDISDMMVFLCSDESRYVTGSALAVDAGCTLR